MYMVARVVGLIDQLPKIDKRQAFWSIFSGSLAGRFLLVLLLDTLSFAWVLWKRKRSLSHHIEIVSARCLNWCHFGSILETFAVLG
jgi:hypothetical protein